MLSRARALFLLSVAAGAILTAATGARAWDIEPGVVLGSDNVTTYTTGDTITVVSTLQYESAVGALIINGFILDLAPDDGETPYNWTLLSADLDLVIVQGNTTVNGTFHFAGFNGLWNVIGVYGMPDFTIAGPTSTFTVPPGNQTIVLLPAGNEQSGPRLAMDAAYSPDNNTINIVVVLSNADGTALSGQALNIAGTIFDVGGPPDVLATVTFTESPTMGVYYGGYNVSLTPILGRYLVTAQWDGLTGGKYVIVTALSAVTLTTGADEWIPALLAGLVALWFFTREAFFPGTIAAMAAVNFLFPTPIFGIPAAVMLVLASAILHILAVRGIIPGGGNRTRDPAGGRDP